MLHHKSKIFCDMDGVLVDFVSGASELINDYLQESKELGESANPRWSRVYRRILRDGYEDYQVSTEDDLRLPAIRNLMFQIIAQDPGGYFRDLGPCEDGVNQLWPFLTSSGRRVALLTAGIPGDPRELSAKSGKKKWAASHLNPSPSRVICVPAVTKREFAMEGGHPNILIDDKLRTIDQWNEDGGIGLLHITGRSDVTIQNLKKIGV